MMEDAHRTFNLWKMLLVLARRRKFIISFVLLATVVAVVTALVLPKWYRAKTSILPSQHDQPMGILGNYAQYSLSSAGFELPIMATVSDVFATMLKSETVRREVIRNNDLQKYLDIPSMYKCLLYLKENTKVKTTGEGVVEVYFEDKDPVMAAQVANSYITQLDKLNREIKAAKARSDKEFVLARLTSTKQELDSLRDEFLHFQTENKALDLQKQQEVAFSAASELRRQLAVAQVSYEIKKKLYSENHPEVLRLGDEISELNRQIALIEQGAGKKESFFNLPLADIPALSVQYDKLRSGLKIQQQVYEMLTGMYEEARIKEQKDTPTISVLETAYPPEIKSSPQRSVIVALTFAGSLILAIFIALFADYLENLRRISPSDFDLINRVRNEITGKTGYSDS